MVTYLDDTLVYSGGVLGDYIEKFMKCLGVLIIETWGLGWRNIAFIKKKSSS